MAFRIEPTNRPEDYVDFTVVTNDGSEHEIRLQKNDCLDHGKVEELQELFRSVEETDLMSEVNRKQLAIIAPDHEDVWSQITERQITQILTHYREASEGDLGE